ncbi:adenosine deaminase family protein [Legionella sp. D16C41]|uniref:adenosine deaminase family protein n=1 Tax=Legionella sp. D16C41 TaxID=3402688 RepID=UPI003AF89359
MRLALLFILFMIQLNCFATVEEVFEAVKKDPKQLHTFLKAMPKGGELHYHLAGGAYPEAMLTLAANGNYCLKSKTFALTYQVGKCLNSGIKVNLIPTQSAFYNKTIQAWSFKNFKAKQESGHDHFFNSFYKFMPIVINQPAPLLAKVMQRAAAQHELYMEIMLSVKDSNQQVVKNQRIIPRNFNHLKQLLFADPTFNTAIQEISSELTNLLPETKKYLGCHTQPKQAVCQLKVNFQLHVLREQPLANVFAQALLYFTIAAKVPQVVAVNLVQAEDGPLSLKDYHQQMEIFNFMHQLYPEVHIALHAGELAKSAGIPLQTKNLRFHINEAIKLGHAERIGHGVDIKHETNVKELVNYMAYHPIPVEINLTSNKRILNVFKDQHPFKFYLNHQVPIVLSTDDEGILRTSLTHEYITAVTDYNLDYQTLKRINHNALTYSFLPGKSLWANPITLKPIKACQKLNSQACLNFVKTSEKARLQRQLALKFMIFEKAYNSVANFN